MTDTSGAIPIDEAKRRRDRRAGRAASGATNDDAAASLKPIDLASWDDRPAPQRRWIVPGMVPEGAVTMLSGDGGKGKTLLALQLLVACALGVPWLGLAVRPCKAVGVFCEDDAEELNRRLEDILRSYGKRFSDVAETLDLHSRVDEDSLLITFSDKWQAGDATPFYSQMLQRGADFGAELVVFDSLHDLFAGDENSRPHARQFIGRLRRIATQQRGAVLLTAHPSLTGRNSGTGEAGSTAWNNAVRSRLYLTEPKAGDDEAPQDSGRRELRTMKANYAAAGERIEMQWRDGVFVRDGSGDGVLGLIARRTAERVFLDLLAATDAQGRPVSSSDHAGNFAPRRFAAMGDRAEGHGQRSFRTAMESLFTQGRIKAETYGRKSDPRTRIVLAEAGRTPSKDEPK